MKKSNVGVVIGDIFKSEAQTLINTVNCVGVMGKGLALEFKNRFPDMYKDYLERCQKGEVKLGKPYLYKSLIPPYILLFPTKQHWRSFSNLSAIEEGLEFLKARYKKWGITSIAVPPLGCGLGELDWTIVGPTLYRHLSELDVSVILFAPYGTPHAQLTAQFLSEPSEAQLVETKNSRKVRIEAGFISLIEILRRITSMPYHWPIGRTTFQKLAYFGTFLGLRTGLEYKRGSFGPFSPQLKHQLTRLLNNGLIREEQRGSMFRIEVGDTFRDARQLYDDVIKSDESIVSDLTDLFCRLNSTKQAELAATVHYAHHNLRHAKKNTPSEKEVLDEVMKWKQRRRPAYNQSEVAITIRHLAVLGWIDVEPSQELPIEVEAELEV